MADLAPSLLEYDQEIVGGNLAEYFKISLKLGGEIAEHASLVRQAFDAQRSFLATATQYAKPSDSEVQKLLGETSNAIANIQKFREARRASPVFNHLSAISESIPALAWVAISPTPAPHVKEMNDAGQFYTNRVLKDFKDKPGHADWVKAWVGSLTTLQSYVKKNHTTGLVWGKQPYKGVAAAAGGPPLPPPPPPVMDFNFDDLQVSSNEKAAQAALFAELNRGEDVTRGLKKVSDDMKTHKNPNLKSSGVVPNAVGGHGGGSQQANSRPAVAKPPKFGLEGKKWVIENHIGNRDLVIDKVEMGQVVYVFGCKECTLKVNGKVNSIVLDSCVKSAVVFNSVVASAEFINSRDCQMQIMGTCPTITIDKVDGLQMYLSKDSLGVEIVSAKSSALNVMIPQASGEYTELPIPEQFKTVLKGKGLVTTPNEVAG